MIRASARDPNSNAGDGGFGIARYDAPPFGQELTPIPTATQQPGGHTPTPSSGCQVSYSDVSEGSTFYPYVECLSCQSIVSGFADGTFHPNADITRGQLAKIISNAAGWNDLVTGQTFSDVPPGSAFYEYVERAASHGAIGDYSDGTFRPGNNATRGQTSKIVSNSFFPDCQSHPTR